ncbi:MAG: ATP-binding protein, partial [Roseiarcus sp.]
SRDLSDALRRHGISTAVMVTEGKRWPTASIKISDAEWLVLPSALPPPTPMELPSLAGWLLLIALGTTGVALIVVHRLTQPLALVVRTVTRIGPEGEVPELPEIGPPEVRATARAINMLSSRLKSAMESRMRLVAAAGHDLRTPMTRLRLRAEFLEDDRDKWLADLDELDRIADSAIRLVREETEGTPADTVRLDEMVGDIAAELQELRLDIRMTDGQAASVRARPLSLKRALRNLMINAATHGGGASVTVAAEASVAVITIEDRGPGIPEAQLEHAFEPFFRVDPARRASVPGAGLGLAIAREIIQRNLGQLRLANRQGGGLTQRVTLPLAGADA